MKLSTFSLISTLAALLASSVSAAPVDTEARNPSCPGQPWYVSCDRKIEPKARDPGCPGQPWYVSCDSVPPTEENQLHDVESQVDAADVAKKGDDGGPCMRGKMPTIKDLSIDPTSNSSTFLHGFLGVTPTLTVSGLLKFTLTKPAKIQGIRIKLKGINTVQIALADRKVAREEKEVLQQRSMDLLPKDAGKNKVGFQKGDFSYPFEFILDERTVRDLPCSLSAEIFPEDAGRSSIPDVAKVVYTLEAEVEMAPGLFGGAKIERCIEEVDFPKISIPNVLRSEKGDHPTYISGANSQLEWRVTVSKSTFAVGDPVTFTIHQVASLDPSTLITGVNLAIRQDIILTVDGHTKTIRQYIARPDSKGKIKATSHKTTLGTSTTLFTGSLETSVPTTHLKLKEHKKAIDVFSTTEEGMSELFKVRHVFELSVGVKGGKECRFETQGVFIDSDKETREWVLRNVDSLGAGVLREE
ncbi:hypothetical protein HDV05_001889 [Chytridiales sp. JEL 0842]|nr:hypothetical protein HDV05_001889 [Chytridiales sp. JEL 0842]